MHIRNEQLAELLSLTAQGISQLSEALTTFSFELMASEDPAARIASRRMVSRVSAIQSAFEQQLRVLNSVTAPNLPDPTVEVDQQASPDRPDSDETFNKDG